MIRRSALCRKLIKLLNNPGVFFRDLLNKKYPIIRNEILCPEYEEAILIRHDLQLETVLDVKFPIDVVFTWVNDKDPVWQEKYNFFKDFNVNTHGQYATDKARFSNHNELYFSIKSVLKFLPWVRNIYVVTDGQIPEWIDEYPGLIIVDHKEIISEKYLPTFNSHVIEAHLHQIPDLSEHFIYFNDDVFVARPLPVGHFFRSNGIASLFLSQKSITEMQKRGVATPTLSASINVGKLLEKEFGYRIVTPLVHTYVPLRRSAFEAVWEKYSVEIDSFLSNKFRTNNDLNLATFFVPWFSYIISSSTPARDICYYFNVRSPVAKHHYAALTCYQKDVAPHSFCANDFTISKKSVDNYQHSLMEMLTSYFK